MAARYFARNFASTSSLVAAVAAVVAAACVVADAALTLVADSPVNLHEDRYP